MILRGRRQTTAVIRTASASADPCCDVAFRPPTIDNEGERVDMQQRSAAHHLSTIDLSVSTGMAKPMPADAPEGEKIAVFIPMSLPRLSSSAPPLLPGLIAASVCITFRIVRPVGDFVSLPRPEITPEVRVWSSPKGLPIARAACPTCRVFDTPRGVGRSVPGGASILRERRLGTVRFEV